MTTETGGAIRQGYDSWHDLPPLPAGVREVQLAPDERVRVGVDGNGFVAATFYRARRRPDDGPLVHRYANRRATLGDVLAEVLEEGESRSEWRTVEAYIRALPWGGMLP